MPSLLKSNPDKPASKQPIPEHAKCVFEVKIFSVYQWEQEMFDGSTEIFEKLRRPDTVGIVPITPDGKVVVSFQEQPGLEPFCGLLGGRVDPGETFLEAAERELLEEAGMQAEVLEPWIVFQPVEKIDWAISIFIARGCQKAQAPNLDAGEKITIKTIEFEEFLAMAVREDFRDVEVTLHVCRALATGKRDELKQLLLVGDDRKSISRK